MPEIHTPISDDEAEEWVRRMVTSPEDAEQLLADDEWLEFVSSKLLTERGFDASADQLGRMFVIRREVTEAAGFRTEFPFPLAPTVPFYRDIATGRRLSTPDAASRAIEWWRM